MMEEAESQAFERLSKVAKRLGGWAEIEKLVRFGIAFQLSHAPADTVQFLRDLVDKETKPT